MESVHGGGLTQAFRCHSAFRNDSVNTQSDKTMSCAGPLCFYNSNLLWHIWTSCLNGATAFGYLRSLNILIFGEWCLHIDTSLLQCSKCFCTFKRACICGCPGSHHEHSNDNKWSREKIYPYKENKRKQKTKKKHSLTSAERFKHCVMCMYVLKDFQMCCVLDTCIFLLQEMNVVLFEWLLFRTDICRWLDLKEHLSMHDSTALELSQIASVPKDADSHRYPARDGLFCLSHTAGNQQEIVTIRSYKKT